MSHFTVLVIGENPEQQLQPYQENNNGDCPAAYLEFVDLEDEHREKYATETVEMVVMPDGRLLLPWDDAFRIPGTFGMGSDTHAAPPDLERRQVPMRERYPDFEGYMADWVGCVRRDPQKNRYGYWENPNRKWDWYQLGGRWTGFFKIKDAVMRSHQFDAIAVGEPGFGAQAAARGYADQARKSQIDFEGMRAQAAAEADERYSRVEAVMAGLPAAESFAAFRERHADINDARAEYWAQPMIAALSAAGLLPMDSSYRDYYCLDKGGRAAYVDRAKQQALSTHAVLKDGRWYERGAMGWWGIVTDEMDVETWIAEFEKLVDDLPEDTLLSVYDCHI